MAQLTSSTGHVSNTRFLPVPGHNGALRTFFSRNDYLHLTFLLLVPCMLAPCTTSASACSDRLGKGMDISLIVPCTERAFER